MQINKTVVRVFGVAATMLLSASAANATCTGLAGTWYFYALQVRTPGITTQQENVVTQVSPQQKTTIETFAFTNNSTGYTNGIGTIIQCTINVQPNGTFTGAPCKSTNTSGGADNVTVSGQLSVSSCNLSGTIQPQGDKLVTIAGGRISGSVATGVATQPGGRVMHFTLSK